MSHSVASDREAIPSTSRGSEKTIAIVAAKLIVTGACFWYLSRQIDLDQVVSAISLLDFRWTALAVGLVMIEIPLVAMRWREILIALAALDRRMTRAAMTAITAIGVFFTQVLPSVAGEGMRTWLLVKHGCDWRNAITSVVMDRAVGAGLMIALAFVILLLPSGLSTLGGFRDLVLVVYGGMLLGGGLGLLLLPRLIPLLERVRYLHWLARLGADARRVVLGPNSLMIFGTAGMIHALTIATIWSLGRAQGLALPVADAAVLFAVVMGVALVPISIGGWGLRELAVVTLLGRHGIAPEQALLFSVCFGLVLAVASLPGAVVWLLYSVDPAKRPSEGSG